LNAFQVQEEEGSKQHKITLFRDEVFEPHAWHKVPVNSSIRISDANYYLKASIKLGLQSGVSTLTVYIQKGDSVDSVWLGNVTSCKVQLFAGTGVEYLVRAMQEQSAGRREKIMIYPSAAISVEEDIKFKKGI
jgi:hypothetical protein